MLVRNMFFFNIAKTTSKNAFTFHKYTNIILKTLHLSTKTPLILIQQLAFKALICRIIKHHQIKTSINSYCINNYP